MQLGIHYGGPFQDKLNELMSPGNVKATAAGFRSAFGAKPYKMGTWAQQLMNDTEFGGKPLRDDWAKATGTIPSFMRAAVEAVITDNMNSSDPMPMRFLIVPNLQEPRHELIVKTTVDSDKTAYIGIEIRCG